MRSDVTVVTKDNSDSDARKPLGQSSCRPDRPRIVTTSWDDGDPLDLQVTRMLADRKLPGTFYIPVKGHHGSGRIDRTEMLSLDSWGFEIGAHGFSHPNLLQCEPRQLLVEVEGSKKRLEDDLGKEVTMFAYPRGKHNRRVIASVRQAGFTGARTTAMLSRKLTFDPFRMPTSVQVFPHSRGDYARNLARAGNFGRAWRYLTRLSHGADWVDLAMSLFDMVLKNGGVWHLYGHSWEIDELNLWEELRVVLDSVSNRPGVLYLSNSAVVRVGAVLRTGTVLGREQPVL